MHERALPNPWRLALVLGLAFALAASAVLAPNPVRGGAAGQKVVIIVGPVGGGSIQTNYLTRGEQIAQSVEARGGTAVRVFSPNATWANVLAAVNGANVIVYIGHGSGYPNPYSSTLQVAWNNGWGLNRIAGIDSADPTGHGHNLSTQMIYCGEAAIEGKPKPSSVSWSQWCAGGPIQPAPGFVMVFSNACYAPGAGETESTTPTSQTVARQRVQYFSRPYIALGGNYFASDLGSRSVVEAILDNPDVAFGDIFRLGSGYSDTAVRGFPHALLAGKQAWIQKTSGPGGLMSYWYAFAGDPARTPAGGTAPYEELPPAPDEEAPYFVARTPVPGATNVSTTTSVTVRFNEAVLGVGSNNTVLRDNSTSAVVAATVTYDPATFTASLVPNAPLMANRLYRMAMSGSIVDTTGNPLPFSQWYFTTGASANAGFTNQVTFNPWRTVAFSAGTHTGYLYSSSGGVTGSKSYTLAAGSSASAAGRATINGTSHVLIANGVWANYWMPESGVVVLQVELAPPPAVNETYDPPRTLYLAAGTYVGRQFSSTGAITASKSYTLAAASSAPTSRRSTITGQSGTWFYITAGVWAGYWIPESSATTLSGSTAPPPPPAVNETYDPPRTLYLAAGTYVGRQFSSTGAITASKSYTLAAASSAPTSRRSTITGQSGTWFYITAGVWAGYWIPESSATTLAP